ncbi:kinase [Streptomyces bauhiniae]|uniref:Kinase n=1 Tax=Streptomyces bauhiniae TaxID=2340725 RepID=A0A4Z1DBG5_9ACTN|nr:kinase [Streptomyces bauhiniae]TGN79773.1 kinase [Streptomyces bauhiniae]
MTVGTEETRLIVVRGNSASGKSSVAAGLRARFGRNHYGTMLADLVREHRGVSRCYYLDVPLTETLVRHATKGDAAYLSHVTDDHLRDWYRERGLLPGGLETVIDASSALADTVTRIMRESRLDGIAAIDR